MKHIDTATLIDIVKNSKEDVKRELNQIENFIADYKIRIGEDYVDTDCVYSVYLKWVAQYNVKPMRRQSMLRTFSKHFKKRVSDGFYYYKLDSTPFLVDAEYVERERLREEEKDKKKKAAKEKKKNRQEGSVPRTE